ncbi:LacI family DNA-binding transcriptional regulator [Opitutus sp. ER46]|uniref:LacI family DNA-binding transcriptional regulator n=1 Tax=Opitutus sp. ER46 TaxID=2161864 RepID=UPI000D326BA6|nr:LacI family DNA-binding transcriptional regulator [Opitutus sp. ER46]PTX95813.1 LacI family transcriptional regulator [Opitutus sp. ER46]
MPAGQKPATKRHTIYDLARHAHVSPGTASRVLNNRDRVDPETRARVLSAARELNLKPRAGVRRQQIAVLSDPRYPDRVEGYAARLSAYASFCLSRLDAAVIHPSDPMTQLTGTFLDGIVAVTCENDLADLLRSLEPRIPVVYLDKFDARPDQPVVCSDHVQGGYLAAQHLIARGKKRLAIVGMDILPMRERLRGFRQAMDEAGITADENLLQLVARDAGATNYTSSITQKVRAGADAIFTPGSSYEGINCLHVLSYVMGLQIPRDVSLVVSEVPGICEVLNPPLTAIEEPLAAMADQAAAMVMRLAAGEKLPRRHVTVPVRLIERASVR